MKVSLALVKQYTTLNLSVDELVARIGSQLGAVEEVIDLRSKYDGIRIVEITEAKPHPNADKLTIYKMTDGREQVQVVSGDRQLEVGDKVAWLAPGTIVPSTYGSGEPITLEARPLRGEMSNGMFGSGKELDINDDHAKVLKLDTDAKPGTLFRDAYDLDDVIIDIENKMFTHRPDCFGLIGLAREIAGIEQIPFTSPDWYLLETGKLLKAQAKPLPLKVTNDIPTLCPQYLAIAMSGVTVGPSPLQLQSYLKRIGIRPISNVVDVTNWLMYLTGQPLHAFDYDKVAALDGSKEAAIVVRTPKEGEQLTLLDGKMITPHKEAILICSRHKPIALGGVMGGLETEVDGTTKNIIIESASFNMYSIRKTAFAQGIFTDAVTRFGKGQSPEQCGVVLAQAIQLMDQLAHAKLATEIGITSPESPETVTVGIDFINARLGADLEPTVIEDLLNNVELQVTHRGNKLHITPGFWRTDLEIPEDIVEEVGRLYGFANLPYELPMRSTTPAPIESFEIFKSTIRSLLAMAGNNELQTYSFVAAKLLSKTRQDQESAYRLRNAISPELELVRTSLLPSLLDKVHTNHKAGQELFGLFEIGKIHNKHDLINDPGSLDDQLPREHVSLGYIFSADKKAAHTWGGAPFYQAKRELSYLLDALHYAHYSYELLGEAHLSTWWLQNLAIPFEPQHTALVSISGVPIGIVGEFNRSTSENFKLPAFIAGFEIDLGLLHGISATAPLYTPLSRFPYIEQDICFKVKSTVQYADLEKFIHTHFASDQRLKITIEPVDIYQRLEDQSHKQMTYRLILQHHDRTLATDEVNSMLEALAIGAHKQFGAERI